MDWVHSTSADGALEISLPLEVLPSRGLSSQRFTITPAYGCQLPSALIAALTSHDRTKQVRCLTQDTRAILAAGTLAVLPNDKRSSFVLDGGDAPAARASGAEFKFHCRNRISTSVEYRGTVFRSLGEARLALFFTLLGWDYTYEPTRFQFPPGTIPGYEDVRCYTPDFLIVVSKRQRDGSVAATDYIYVEYKPGKPTLKDLRRCLALSLSPAFTETSSMLLMHGQLHLADREGGADEAYDYSESTTGLQVMRFFKGAIAPGAIHIVWERVPGFAHSDGSFLPAGWNDPRLVAALARAAAASHDAAAHDSSKTPVCADAGSADEG